MGPGLGGLHEVGHQAVQSVDAELRVGEGLVDGLGLSRLAAPLPRLGDVPEPAAGAAHVDHASPGPQDREENLTRALVGPVVGCQSHFGLEMYFQNSIHFEMATI